MKKTYLTMLVPVLMMVFLSCKKESINTQAPLTSSETMAVKIAANQSYILNLPDAGSLSISRQATHFSLSEASLNAETGVPSYKYTPAKDFTGADEIVLLSSKTIINYSGSAPGACSGSAGTESKTSSISQITLKITVAN